MERHPLQSHPHPVAGAPQQDSGSAGRTPVATFLAVFGYAWVMIGLFTGTIVLVFFVRGLLGATGRFGWDADVENRLMMAVMLAFVIASFLLTRSVVKRLYRVSSSRGRRLALGALVIPGALSMWAWSDPTRLLAGFAGGELATLRIAGGPEFVFGPYPQPERLAELKREGFTAIVSLQHPAVPVEVQGIAREKDAAARLGLTLIIAPMLPWISDNEESLNIIRTLARTGEGRYYVHCGLGRDRVNVVKRVIESMSLRDVKVAAARDLKAAATFEARTEPFELGVLVQLRKDAWMIPLPNEAELAFTVFGVPGSVIAVLDPGTPAHAAWLGRARTHFDQYAIPFELIPFSAADARSAERRVLLANRLRSEDGRITIVVPRTSFSGKAERGTEVAQVVRQAFDR